MSPTPRVEKIRRSAVADHASSLRAALDRLLPPGNDPAGRKVALRAWMDARPSEYMNRDPARIAELMGADRYPDAVLALLQDEWEYVALESPAALLSQVERTEKRLAAEAKPRCEALENATKAYTWMQQVGLLTAHEFAERNDRLRADIQRLQEPSFGDEGGDNQRGRPRQVNVVLAQNLTDILVHAGFGPGSGDARHSITEAIKHLKHFVAGNHDAAERAGREPLLMTLGNDTMRKRATETLKKLSGKTL